MEEVLPRACCAPDNQTIMNPLYLFDSHFTNLKALPVLKATLQCYCRDLFVTLMI
uniref:Uncharacterized protein n=1 Tax=Hyaloperonospora arabidopsidis (strain Emoy2) TaxID=559515 RepID=M4B2T7_HYAAE